MYSVTQRVGMTQQPKGGYLPVYLFNELQFWDENEIVEVTSGVKSIQGMAVDYLTRFMLGQPRQKAFEISLIGAQMVSDTETAKNLLQNINGLDERSIACACKLVGYDAAYRRGTYAFTSIDSQSISPELISNIHIMVNRSLSFFKKYGPTIKCGFTLDGGYNGIISRGDGDYLTRNSLLDFKVSAEPLNPRQTLQLAVYYIMGIHSIYPEFRNITKLGVYNPPLNRAYFADINDISNNVFVLISRDVIGYRFSEKDNWIKACNTDSEVFQKCVDRYRLTGFSPTNYKDGIYEVAFDDYWSFSFAISNLSVERPSFSRSEKIVMIKNGGFYMFVSVSHSRKKSISIMHGGQLRKLSNPLQYYYDRLPEYGNIVLKAFSNYWNALYSLSDFMKSIQSVPTERNLLPDKELQAAHHRESSDTISCMSFSRFDGKVHGCIVNLDFYNHLFLNPFDGTITPYHALSTSEKYIYRDIESLLKVERPEMLESYTRQLEKSPNHSPLELSKNISAASHLLESLPKCEFESIPQDKDGYLCTDEYMYYISGIFKLLQPIYDCRLVTIWHDNLLPPSEKEYPVEDLGSILGQSAQMVCGMEATVILDCGANDITVKFADGTTVEHISRRKFKNRTVVNPNAVVAKSQKKRAISTPRKRDSYIGQTRKMNCGYVATVIEDFGCNDITIRFDDGLVRKHCRRDKFRAGKIAHTQDLT